MADSPDRSIPEDVIIAGADWAAIAVQFLSGLAEHLNTDKVRDTAVAAAVQAKGAVHGATAQNVTGIAGLLGRAIAAIEEPFLPVLAAFIAPMVAGLFGTEADVWAFSKRANGEARNAAAEAMVDAFMRSIAGDAGQAEPTQDGAKRIAGAAVHAVLEGWFMGAVPELLSDALGFEGMGHFTAFTELPEEMIRALGVGRLVRRALAPLVDATCATPMKWATEKTYRTALLPPSTAARQWMRGRWDWEDVVEELARQGYSDERIDALISEQRKAYSVADVYALMQAGQMARGDALAHLRDAGYDDERAAAALQLELVKDIAQFETQLAGAAVSAYAEGRIDAVALDQYTTGAALSAEQTNRLRELAAGRRALRNKPLSPSQAEACVKAGILAVPDYVRALETDGYAPESIDALELLLRAQLDKEHTIEEHRAQQDADRAKAEQERAAKAAIREKEVAAQRAFARRGALADLKRAVVTGLIPVARYVEVLNADYDGDTVQILVDQVNQDRAAYVAAAQQRADAVKRAGLKLIDVGQLEAAVVAGVLSIDEFRTELRHRGLQDRDIDILARTLDAKVADLNAAKKKRADAEQAARFKKIDLTRFEQLVRRGVRTLAQYSDLLRGLGYDDASIAGMGELLQLHIADDARAAKLRAGVTAGDPTKGLSLDQARQAVILGISSEDEFQRFLVDTGYTADAQVVLLEELRDDVSTAEAARRRRSEGGASVAARTLPLATITKAASLGFIAPDAYQARLEAFGYADDDVALELELLRTEIAAVQATRAKEAAAGARAEGKGFTLVELGAAVKHGQATLEQYRARAVEFGFKAADADTLVRLLADELETTNAAKARREEIAGELDTKDFSLAALEDQVRAGARSIESYQALLEAKGYAADDVELLGALLVDTVAG